jgi:hypothetical protein
MGWNMVCHINGRGEAEGVRVLRRIVGQRGNNRRLCKAV